MASIEKTFIERRVYPGAPVHRGYRVRGIKCVKDPPDSKPRELVKAHDIVGYSAGCPLHRGSCFGHMCITPAGSMLPPHSLSFRSGDIMTKYYVASAKAFENDAKAYIDALKETNYGKHGHLRSIMSTPVSGSARLVCIPHGDLDPFVVYMSKTLAEGILFCAPEVYDDGSVSSRYVERPLREGDYVMVERAPSLSKYNNQPLRLAFWDVECMGMHPKTFSYFHGDYDGDECHVYALGSPASLEEARRWAPPLDKRLCAAEKCMRDNFPQCYPASESKGDLEFISYSTLSFSQIRDGEAKLAIGDMVRTKEEHLGMFRERMNKTKSTQGFLAEAVKGVRDIMRQQVSQGRIGDMSRVARIACMCFVRGSAGGTYVVTRRSRVLLAPHTQGSTGSPAVRCVMVLCQASQEAALHAHRVGSSESKGVDLVASLLEGRSREDDSVSQDTLLVLSSGGEALEALGAISWKYETADFVAVVCKDDRVSTETSGSVKGAFSPVVLSSIAEDRRRQVCRTGLNVVYNYYGLELEGDDIEDMVEAMCYRVGDSTCPITSRQGMMERGLGWIETLMACDYTKLPYFAGSSSGPYSATSATLCSNFSRLEA